MKNKIVFLTYLSRSGSTLLARMLDEYKDIGVSLEARIPDGIEYGNLQLKTSKNVHPVLKRLYRDIKFQGWDIEVHQLQEKLFNLKFPARFNQFLQAILSLYFQSNPAHIHVYKCGHYLKYLGIIRLLFPQSKMIYILRDIRAIYNSQKKTIDSIKGKPMISGNPVLPALNYKMIISILEQHKHKKWLHKVKYEDLIDGTDNELEKILQFLNASSDKFNNQTNYADKIADNQKKLHPNVASSPIKDRKNAWEKNLNKSEILFFQSVLKKEMKKYNYKTIGYKNIQIKEMVQLILYLFEYHVIRFPFSIFWLLKYKIRPLLRLSM